MNCKRQTRRRTIGFAVVGAVLAGAFATGPMGAIGATIEVDVFLPAGSSPSRS